MTRPWDNRSHRSYTAWVVVQATCLAFVLLAQATISAPIIVDNGDSDYSTTGSWNSGGGTGYGGDRDFTTSVTTPATHTATWTFDGLSPGSTVEVLTTWEQGGSRLTAVSHTVTGNVAAAGAMVRNQNYINHPDVRSGGRNFSSLGVYKVTSGGTLTVIVDNHHDSVAGDYVIADAMMLADPVSEVYRVLNGQNGVNEPNTGVSRTGTWGSWPFGGDGGAEYSPATVASNSAPTGTYTWQFEGLVAGGTYDVYASFDRRGDFSSAAPYTVSGVDGGPVTFYANQDSDERSTWHTNITTDVAVNYDKLGTVVVSEGGTATVMLGNNVADDNPPGDATYVIADRVLLDLISLPTPPAGTIVFIR